MNLQPKPTLEDLSLYFDGLLDEPRRNEVQAWLDNDPQAKRMIRLFERFKQAQQPKQPEPDLDRFLSDTLQNIHTRIYTEDRVGKYPSTSFTAWLSPKVLGLSFTTAVAVITLMVTLFPQPSETPFAPNSSEPPLLTGRITPTPLPEPSLEENLVQDEIQRQALITTARFAKNWLDQGWQYAALHRERVTQPLQELKTDAEKALTLSQLPPLLPRMDRTDETPETPPPAIQTLAQVGQQQVALGLSVSLLTLASGL